MSKSAWLKLGVFVVFACAPWIAQARDLKLELPINPAISEPVWKAGIGQSIQFQFMPMGVSHNSVGVELEMSNYARPYVFRNGHRVHRSEGPTCNEALRNLLSDAVQEAKSRGATAVFLRTTKYGSETPSDSKRFFLCNAGTMSSTVDAVVAFGVVNANRPPVPPPVLVAATIPQPIASGYAEVSEVNRLPYATEGCIKHYNEWLTKPKPRAFAVVPRGSCYSSWSTTPSDKTLPINPVERVVVACNRIEKNENQCALYAVDDVVVWRP